MTRLEDFTSKGMCFEIVKATFEGIELRIKNEGNYRNTSLGCTRFISRINGVLELEDSEPSDDFGGLFIPENSFIDVFLTFNQGQILDGDRIHLCMDCIGKYILTYTPDAWYVTELPNNQDIEETLNQKLEVFYPTFSRFGMSIDHPTVRVSDVRCIHFLYEIMSNEGTRVERKLYLNVVLYDQQGKIISKNQEYIEPYQFMGFEVMDHEIGLPCDATEIAMIKFYLSSL